MALPTPGLPPYTPRWSTELDFWLARLLILVPPPLPGPQLMAFSGPAPELINGRLSMLAFVAALGAELSSGEPVLRQLGQEPTGELCGRGRWAAGVSWVALAQPAQLWPVGKAVCRAATPRPHGHGVRSASRTTSHRRPLTSPVPPPTPTPSPQASSWPSSPLPPPRSSP